jgi:hypothetical protein
LVYSFGPFYSLLVYCFTFWYIVSHFGILFHILVYCTKKNLATLAEDSFMYVPRYLTN